MRAGDVDLRKLVKCVECGGYDRFRARLQCVREGAPLLGAQRVEKSAQPIRQLAEHRHDRNADRRTTSFMHTRIASHSGTLLDVSLHNLTPSRSGTPASGVATVSNTKTLPQRPPARDLTGPALGLRDLKTGVVYELRRRQNAVVIGSGASCAIRLTDPYASGAHCVVERRGDMLRVHDYRGGKNPTRVNGLAIEQSDLPVGAVLTVGQTSLLVVGPGNRDDRYGTPSLDEIVRATIDMYGSTRAAAKALGVPKSTLARWAAHGRGGGKDR